MIDRRSFTLAAGSLLLGATARAQAQAYPTKPIRLIVPYPPADLADIIARLITPKLTELLGQSIVVENKPGASGQLGLQQTLAAEPDGYTFVIGQMGSMAVAPVLNKQPFDVREEFIPVALMYSNYLLLAAHPGFAPRTVEELVAYAKAKPGQLRLGTNGEGGFPHLAVELLRARTGLDFIHVPYKGSNQATTDTIGGQIDVTISGYSGLYPHVQNSKLKPIAVTSKGRPFSAPQVPAIGETVPGYEALGWFGLYARKGTPAAAVAAVNAAINTIVAMPDVAERAKVLGLDVAAGTPESFRQIWMGDYDKWGGIIRSLKLNAKT